MAKSYAIPVSTKPAPVNLSTSEEAKMSYGVPTAQKCDMCDHYGECSVRASIGLHVVCEIPYAGDLVMASNALGGTDDERVSILVNFDTPEFSKGYTDGIFLRDPQSDDAIYLQAHTLGTKVKMYGVSNVRGR